VIPAPSPLGPSSVTSYDPFILPMFPESIPESELDGLACESFLFRRQRTSTRLQGACESSHGGKPSIGRIGPLLGQRAPAFLNAS
jgi:hypothetical protein